MMKRQKYKPVGTAEMKLGVLHRFSGFAFVASCNRLILRRRPSRVVSATGINGLRWYNRTGKRRKAVQLKLRRRWPRMVREARKNAPLKMRRPSCFMLY